MRCYQALLVVLLQKHGLLKAFKISEQVLLNYLAEVEDHYHAEVPYHNSTHAADVTQSAHVLISSAALRVRNPSPLTCRSKWKYRL